MNKITSKVIITLFLGLLTISCTLPFYFASAPTVEEKIVYVEITSTPVIEQATEAASVATEAAVVTPTVSVNLDGPWTIWQGSSEQQLSIDFLQVGYELIGNTATGSGQSLLIKGVVSQDGKSVIGTWESTSGTSGNFMMALNDALSGFSGNLGGGVSFCGTRTGSLKPSPCLK